MKLFKSFFPLLLIASICALPFILTGFQQKEGKEPWTEKQLLAPEDLNIILKNPQEKQPIVLSVGPGAVIKGSLDMGPAHEKENFQKLRSELEKLPKDAAIVIYCGCCPFEHCPNIRPAFALLNELKFTNPRLLNIKHNIKTDWIDKGYRSNK